MLKGGIIDWLWDAVFPQFCVVCGLEGGVLCVGCEAGLPVSSLFLPVNQHGLDSVRSVGLYEHGGGLARVIEVLKYQYSAPATRVVERLVRRWVAGHTPLVRPDAIIPIPLHRRRLAERGFNQAAVIANALAAVMVVPVWSGALTRRRATKQQAKLNRVERQANVVGAFMVKKPPLVKERLIWLVDDVYTTGNTMQAATQVLVAAGAKVVGFTLARG